MIEYLNFEFRDSPDSVNTYDELPLWSAPFGLLLLKNVELESNITVLDIGCGTGFPLIEIAQRLGQSCKVFGLDPWVNAHTRVKQKIKSYEVFNVELIGGVGEYIPFGTSQIDLIVSNLGINNFDNPDRVFGECFRVLRTNGKVALTTNLFGHWKEFYDEFARTLSELDRPNLITKLREHEEHRGTIDAISALLLRNGFVVSRHFEDQFEMRFLNGSSFLRHHFTKLGFLDAWKKIVPQPDWQMVFTELEMNLNRLADRQGHLRLTVPMAYIEGTRK